MIQAQVFEHPRSLTHQISVMEKQISRRRKTAGALATGIRRKVTEPAITPAALVVAMGIGVALEQTSHHQGWSLTAMLDAADAGLRLLLSIKSSAKKGSKMGSEPFF